MNRTPEEIQNNHRLTEAVIFAAQCHEGQYRKGSGLPYILHPMEVVQLLHAMGADNDLLMAGILHDTVEDTAATSGELLSRFGPQVAALVASHTEDKGKPWAERKAADIEEARAGDRRQKMLILADKVANLRSMKRDYARVGEELWTRFHSPKPDQSRFYAAMEEALSDLQFEEDCQEVYWEMDALCKDLFSRFFYHREGSALCRLTAHGENSRLVCGDPRWLPWEGSLPAGARPLSRENAEALEDQWAVKLAEED